MTQTRSRLVWIATLAVAISLATSALTAARDDWTAGQLSRPFPAASSEQELIKTLRSGGKEEQAFACKQLAIHGGKTAVPELAKLLADKELGSWARIALEAIPDPAADKALLEAAKSLDGLLLVGTINSLGARKSADAVDHLSERLQDDDAQVAAAAAVALGRIGNDAATKALRQSLAGAPTEVRSAIAEGCILCAERILADGKNETAAAIYDEVRHADVPQQRVLEATRGAIIARGSWGIPLLVEQLKSPEKTHFQIALSTARQLTGSDVAEALAGELATAPPQRAALIVLAIGDRNDAALPQAVLQAARGGDARVRLAAIEVIGRLGGPSSVDTLLGIASAGDSDASAQLSQAAKDALTHLPGEAVDVELVRRVRDAEGESLAILFQTIGQRRIDATTELVKAVDHRDAGIRHAALTALGATAGPNELSALITEAVDAKNPDDAEVAGMALETASVRMPDREATATQLADAMRRADTPTQARLLEILGAMGGAKALATIAAEAQSDEAELQDVGTRVLGQWMTADAAGPLYDIASSNHRYQTRALRGYLRIARQLNLPDRERLAMCRKALAIAERPQERELALEAMKRSPSAEAIELASSLLDDRELRDQAVETAIFIGEAIKDSDPAAAKSAGEKALEAAPSGELAERARALKNGE